MQTCKSPVFVSRLLSHLVFMFQFGLGRTSLLVHITGLLGSPQSSSRSVLQKRIEAFRGHCIMKIFLSCSVALGRASWVSSTILSPLFQFSLLNWDIGFAIEGNERCQFIWRLRSDPRMWVYWNLPELFVLPLIVCWYSEKGNIQSYMWGLVQTSILIMIRLWSAYLGGSNLILELVQPSL